MTFVAALLGILIAVGSYFFFTLENNRSSLPDDSPLGTAKTLESISRSVNRSGENLTAMPLEILEMQQVRELNLSNNRLTGALPAEIRHLTDLEVLILSQNQMTGLPAEIGQLSKLRVLNVADNELTGLPHELGNLQNLEILDISGNRVSETDLEIIRSRLPSSTQILR